MTILSTKGWDNYALLDSGEGYRLEQFGNYTLQRPDPQAIWPRLQPKALWENADAVFTKAANGKEQWVTKKEVPKRWQIRWKELSFYAKLAPFKHTGVFAEQSLQWEFIQQQLASANHSTKVLNLFGYTGIATLVAAYAGAQVTHVDASKPTISWARESQALSGLDQKPIRWILDDAIKFVKREIKRGARYDGVIMDPPIYGHGPNGQRWDFYDSFPQLLDLTKQVLTQSPLFMIINAYAISASSLMLENVLLDLPKTYGGAITVGELALQEKYSERLLSTGIFARFSTKR